MWCKEKFVYYSNSPGFYAIYFLRKKLFWCHMIYNWDVKIPGKEKKTIMVRNTNLVWCLLDCLFCLSKLLLLLLPWWLSPPLSSPLFRRPRAARRASPGTLHIAFCDARLRDKSRKGTFFRTLWIYTGFPHSSAVWHHRSLYASLPYYFTARYFTHDQCGEWKNSDFRGKISYFTHELYAQNCIKLILMHYQKWFCI